MGADKQRDLCESRTQVTQSIFYKHMKQRLEEVRERYLLSVANASEKELCWELSCEYRGFKEALTIIERLELNNKEESHGA